MGNGKRLSIAAIAAAGLLLSVACSQAPATVAPATGAGATVRAALRRESSPGGVTVMAAPAEAPFLAGKGHPLEHWGFLVEMDTHSVDLTRVEVAGASLLRAGNGAESRPIAWQGLSEDSHHRSGLLVFSGERPQGSIELVMRGLASAGERVLRWE